MLFSPLLLHLLSPTNALSCPSQVFLPSARLILRTLSALASNQLKYVCAMTLRFRTGCIAQTLKLEHARWSVSLNEKAQSGSRRCAFAKWRNIWKCVCCLCVGNSGHFLRHSACPDDGWNLRGFHANFSHSASGYLFLRTLRAGLRQSECASCLRAPACAQWV